MAIKMVVIDIYNAVYSASLKRGLKSGELDIEVPEAEAAPWLGNYALLSSEREIEDESGPVETSSSVGKKVHDKHIGTSNRVVGNGSGTVGTSNPPVRPRT